MKSNLTIQTELANKTDLDKETRERAKKILSFLGRAGTSYLSEIAWECGLTEYHAKMILNHLNSLGAIVELAVDPFYPDRRLLARVAEMSAKGQGGYIHFSRKKWYAQNG